MAHRHQSLQSSSLSSSHTPQPTPSQNITLSIYYISVCVQRDGRPKELDAGNPRVLLDGFSTSRCITNHSHISTTAGGFEICLFCLFCQSTLYFLYLITHIPPMHFLAVYLDDVRAMTDAERPEGLGDNGHTGVQGAVQARVRRLKGGLRRDIDHGSGKSIRTQEIEISSHRTLSTIQDVGD